jgi:glycosyltransferase involved in cell wall biosynthesis
MASLTSVIIPSRNEPYLHKTIQDVLEKATSEIEVIVVLEGYWPKNEELVLDKRVHYLHFTQPQGMRGAINKAVAVARGEYLLKCDAHCMFSPGFDEVLKRDCMDSWVVVPRRYPLDPVSWQIEKRSDNKYPIDYMYLDKDIKGQVWTEKNQDEKLKQILLDDLMTSQGSCWFMKKNYYHWLELLDERRYGSFWHEMQEIGLKCWLSGGRMVVDKNCWYAHWHKTKGRGYSLEGSDKDKAIAYVKRWQSGKIWQKQIHDFQWLITKFNPPYEQ